MISEQYNFINVEEKINAIQANIESNEVSEQIEQPKEAIFIRRQFQSPSLLEIRFALLKRALRIRSSSII